MILIRLAKTPRLARSIVRGLLDQTAQTETKVRANSSWNTPFGQIESIAWYKDKAVVQGEVFSGSLSLAFDGMPTKKLLAASFSTPVSRPDPNAILTVAFQTGDQSEFIRISRPAPWREKWARWRALPRVLFQILNETPAVIHFLRSGDPTIGGELRRRLGLIQNNCGIVLPNQLFGPSAPPQPSALPAIILPIYNAYEDVVQILSRFPVSPGTDHHLILVDDGSNDPRIARLLSGFAASNSDTTTLVSMHRNSGFVAAVNQGFNVARKLTGGHVIILNSDTRPPDNWVRRLLAPIHQDRKTASVTPMSNAAEILSVPGAVQSEMPDLPMVLKIDHVAQTLSPKIATVEVPTGIGFCMAMNRAFLDRIGGFDTAFGKGYGEEVDWCQKARRLGGRNVAVSTLYVAHRGSASFGPLEKTKQIKAAATLVAKRYPHYDQEVQNWVMSDPMAPGRLALTIAGLGNTTGSPIAVYLAHSLGGGAEIAMQREIKDAFTGGASGVVILRVGGRSLWRIEVITPEQRQIAETADWDQLVALLAPLKQHKIIYSCGVGSPDPTAVPKLLHRLTENGTPLEIRLHDYFCISPSWNPLDATGEYHGLPHLETCDPAHSASSSPPMPHVDWRKLWAPLIHAAQEVTAFSNSSAELLSLTYPISSPKIVVRPHQLSHAPKPLEPGGQTIGVLGGINHEKGGTVLMGLTTKRSRRLVVLGEMSSEFSLPKPHLVHGRYERDQIHALARRYDIGVWLTPSVCPETFSFTTHEALATELPVFSFGLGAQAEAVRKAQNGFILESAPTDITGIQREIEAVFDAQKLVRLRSAS